MARAEDRYLDRLLELFVERLATEIADRVERRLAEHQKAAPPAWNGADRLVDMKAAADQIGTSRSTLYKLTATGEIETVKIGHRTFVRASELKRFIESR